MSIFTFVVEFGDGPLPTVGRDTEILGGKLCAVRFDDALAELERATEQRDELLVALRVLLAHATYGDPSALELADKAIANAAGGNA